MLGMIRQAEVALNHFGYAHRRPQVVGPPIRRSAFLEQGDY